MIDFVEINKFGNLHNNDTIVFCKTDYILQDFNKLSDRTKPLIFISGNSDYPIDDDLIKRMPKCIVKWFAQNYIGKPNDIVEPIPLGIENSFAAHRSGHTDALFTAKANQQIELLSKSYTHEPTRFAYVNFRNWTNPRHRQLVKETCKLYDHFTMQSEVDFPTFISDILDHQCVVCAQGNELGDNLRVYETLYLNRIPITFNPYLQMHKYLPHILITDLAQLADWEWLEEQRCTAYERAVGNWEEMLTASYWISRIKEFEKAIK